jgi:hypothetical protein
MTVFDAARDVLFADPNFGVDATWRSQGAGAPVACRLIIADRETKDDGFGSSGAIARAIEASVRLSEVATPAKGDTFTVGSTTYAVSAQAVIDRTAGVAKVALRGTV